MVRVMIEYRYGHIDKLPDYMVIAFDGQCAHGQMAWSWMAFAGLVAVKFEKGLAEAKKLAPSKELAEWNAVGRGLRWLLDEKWAGSMVTTKGTSLAVFNGLTGRDDDSFPAQLKRCRDIVAAIKCKRFSVLASDAENESCFLLSMAALRGEK